MEPFRLELVECDRPLERSRRSQRPRETANEQRSDAQDRRFADPTTQGQHGRRAAASSRTTPSAPTTSPPIAMAILKSPSYKLAEFDVDFLRPQGKSPAADAARAAQDRNAASRASDRFHGRRVRRHADRAARAGRGRAARSAAQRRESRRTIPRLARTVQRAERILAKSHFYDEAREFSRLVSTSQDSRRPAASSSS